MHIEQFDHCELYAGDAQQLAFHLCQAYRFQVLGQGGPETGLADQRSVLLGHGDIRLLVTSGLSPDHPAARYVARHGDGVAMIGLRTPDAAQAFSEAVRHGARPVEQPRVWLDGDAVVVTAAVSGFGDVAHRFVERRSGETFLPGCVDGRVQGPGSAGGLLETLDHIAVCVNTDEFEATVEQYRTVYSFDQIFEERIEIGAQAMVSKVVQNADRTVTFTILAPDPASAPGQLDDFLAAHDGPGVQHLAFSTGDIVTAVATLTEGGARFLTTPSTYYDGIARVLGEVRRPLDRLRAGNILVDRDHWGEMFQIFTESSFVRRTLFFELIERHGALTFGSNNIKALYQAKERERTEATVRA